jgi:hypothetical protein
MGHLKGYFERAKISLTPKLSSAHAENASRTLKEIREKMKIRESM